MMIRAISGHSIWYVSLVRLGPVPNSMDEMDTMPIAYHMTSYENFEEIMYGGIKQGYKLPSDKQKRMHIHTLLMHPQAVHEEMVLKTWRNVCIEIDTKGHY